MTKKGGKAFVAGVGMTKFAKPGRRAWELPGHGARVGGQGDRGRGRDLRRRRARVRGVAVRRLDGRPARGLRAGTHRRADHQRQQQLLDGLLLAVPRPCAGGGRPGRLRAGGGLREDGARLAEDALPGPGQPDGQAHRGDVRADPGGAGPVRGAAVRQRRARAHAPVRDDEGADRQDRREEPPALGQQPVAQFRDEYTLEEILASPLVHEPLTRLQCSPTSDGSAAAIVVTERFLDERDGMADRAVEIVAQSMVTDLQSTFADGSARSIVGSQMTKKAADEVYELAGVGPEDVQVIELHDCFASNELISYEGLGLCDEGEAGRLVDDGDVDYGGTWVVNPSGGLISKGHPLGATGLAQCAELTWQLRGEADARQVDRVDLALQHNIGLGGAAVVSLYRRAV